MRRICCVLLFTLLPWIYSQAQPTLRSYKVNNGKMVISLGKQLSVAALDSFILQYGLTDINIKQFIQGKYLDSLRILGWKLEVNNDQLFVISKPLASYNELRNPAEKIIFTGKNPSFSEMFPVVSSSVKYGYNRFRNKNSFAVNNGMVTFFLRGNLNAGKVMLAGSFNNWSPEALAMQRTDSGWIARVKLQAGKYWYKFIVDGHWQLDSDNSLSENDGLGNMNSVYFFTNTVFRLEGFRNARRVFVAGSFNDWRTGSLAMQPTATGWQLPLYLADGTHTYRFIVDGKWMADPANPNALPNEFGETNSVVSFGRPYVFKLDGYTNAGKVVLAGSFNKWREDELFMKKTATGWELPYTLGPGNYEYRFVIDGKSVSQPANGGRGNLFFIIEPNYTFRLKGYANAKQVYLSGDFNDWSPSSFPMDKVGDEWVFKAHLSDGKHLYKFVVDGKWIIDPGNKLWEQNEHSTGNSVIWIGQ